MAHRALTGVLLVGGASTRFGSPKALAPFDGETLAERAWRLLGETCDERLAFGKRADALALPFELLDDGTDVRAPIAGVVAGLRAAAHELAALRRTVVGFHDLDPAAGWGCKHAQDRAERLRSWGCVFECGHRFA